ncbi:MAG TPA: hypothetical protein VFW11_02610 [Cyclobacteriaceae bacterium]|nr:hypothetical protein [Cyclobacteriaceae bacterium]
MKSIFFFLTICTVFINQSYAQEKTQKTPEQRAVALTEWMKTNLQLMPDQEGTIQSINLKYANLNEGLRTSSKSRMQKFKALKSNDQAKDDELKVVLTDEQFKIYESRKEELKEKFKEEARERRGS